MSDVAFFGCTFFFFGGIFVLVTIALLVQLPERKKPEKAQPKESRPVFGDVQLREEMMYEEQML